MKREEYIVFVEQKDVDLLATELNDFATLESKTGFMFDYVGVLYENIGLKFEKHDNIDKYGADCCFIVFSINYSKNCEDTIRDCCKGNGLYKLNDLPINFVEKICGSASEGRSNTAYSIKIKGKKLHEYYLDSLRVKGETVLAFTGTDKVYKSRFNTNMYFYGDNVVIMEDPLSMIEFKDDDLYYSRNYDKINDKVFPDMLISINHMPMVLRVSGDAKTSDIDTIDKYVGHNLKEWVQSVKELNGIKDDENQSK